MWNELVCLLPCRVFQTDGVALLVFHNQSKSRERERERGAGINDQEYSRQCMF